MCVFKVKKQTQKKVRLHVLYFVLCLQEAEYQRAMQRRAIRDAKTPEKIKQVKPVVDDGLTLQGKKEKIGSNLERLAELGKVNPENRYQDLINDIAKVKKKKKEI